MNVHFQGQEQSLQDILKCRDMRVQYQQCLLEKYQNIVICYKLNIPGAVKYNFLIKKIFDEGLQVFKDKLDRISLVILEEKSIYKNSGPEYFGAFNIPAYLMKKITTNIEDTHALGRLYDFDVLSGKGEQISRQELGKEPRKCLLCESNAFECGRARRHQVGELIAKIESMAKEYFRWEFLKFQKDITHPLYSVDGKNKGVTYKTDVLGDLTIIGGASGVISAAASILRDIININRGEEFRWNSGSY